MLRYSIWPIVVACSFAAASAASDAETGQAAFAGIVSSATPEATAAGVTVLEAGGNAIDAAIAISLVLGVTEPAGSGIGGQSVMLVKEQGKPAFVIQGTTWSPSNIPDDASDTQLRSGRTASTVPSTLRVLDRAYREYGSGNISWPDLLAPAIAAADDGFIVGPFRHRSFRSYGDKLAADKTAAAVFVKADGSTFQVGDRVRQPQLAATLRRIADAGAMDFYTGDMAGEIAVDMAANGGWITKADLANFPEPAIVPAITGTYRGHDIATLPPPFGGWVVLQILNVLEQIVPEVLAEDGSDRRLALLDALRIGHTSRQNDPITEYLHYNQRVAQKSSKATAATKLADYLRDHSGETTHFSVVDGAGTAVAVTQSIDSYFGAAVMHPTLGFLYNNYMQGFQVADADAPYFLTANEMPLSSMSATIVSRDGRNELVLGSPGSARIISAVAQVSSHWIDTGAGVEAAVAAFRVHVVPDDRAYVEGPEIAPPLLAGMAARGLSLRRPTYGVSDSQLDPYFGGVHAIAFENGNWVGAADPRRDGRVGVASRQDSNPGDGATASAQRAADSKRSLP